MKIQRVFCLGALAGSLCFFVPPAFAERKPATRQQDLYIRDGTNLPYALQELDDECTEKERAARVEYLKVKRSYSRNLDSLDYDEDTIFDKLKGAQKRLNKQLRAISKSCREERTKMISEAKPRAEWIPAGSTPKPIKIKPTPPPVKQVAPPKKKKPVVVQEPPREPSQYRASSLLKNFRMHGRVKQETAYRVSEPHEFTKNRSTLILEQSTRFNDNMRFKFSERGFYDTAVAHKNDENKDVPGYEDDDLESEIELRDAYMDVSADNFDLRLGKQQIVWGEAVSVFVADVVNGRDLREFILPDFDQIRLPQWSALLSSTQGDLHMEGVVSVPRFNKLPKPSAEFAFPSVVPAGVPVVSSDAAKPETGFSNTDIGFRFSYLLGGLDTGFFFLHTWDKNPVPFYTVIGSTVHYRPEFKRQDVMGMTFSKDVFEWIVKGEVAVRPQSYFATTDPAELDGVATMTSTEYILGVDQTWFEKWQLNLQIDQRFLSKNTSYLINEEATRTLISAWLRGRLFNDKVQPEYLIVSNTAKRDRMHRPRIDFRLSDWMIFRVGADYFEGKNKRGVFAVFDDRDRCYGELEFRF